MTHSADPATAAAASLQFNPHVQALPVYNAGMSLGRARAISGRDDIARLGSNENPEGCSPRVLEVLASSAFQPWRYADPACTVLRESLAQRLDVPVSRIVVGNGSEELIAAVSRALLTAGTQVVTVVPSFGLHEIEPLACGATVTKVPMTSALGFDLDALERALHARPRVIFLSSPWNPVGPGLSPAALQRLLAAVQPGTLFVLDEAYFEYADPGALDGLAALRHCGLPYVVLRTFSKAYGLAGLRVGYALCSDDSIARVVSSAKTPFNVNAAAQLAAVAAWQDQAWMLASVERLRVERRRVSTALSAMGLKVAESQTNFLFFDCGGDSAEAAQALLREGIVVKAWGETGFTSYLRCTIGLPADNDRLLAALAARALAAPPSRGPQAAKEQRA